MHQQYQIETGVPIPPRKGRPRGDGMSGVIRSLEPGQSVFLPEGPKGSASLMRVASATGRVIARRSGERRKYAVRTVEGGVRVWRIS